MNNQCIYFNKITNKLHYFLQRCNMRPPKHNIRIHQWQNIYGAYILIFILNSKCLPNSSYLLSESIFVEKYFEICDTTVHVAHRYVHTYARAPCTDMSTRASCAPCTDMSTRASCAPCTDMSTRASCAPCTDMGMRASCAPCTDMITRASCAPWTDMITRACAPCTDMSTRRTVTTAGLTSLI